MSGMAAPAVVEIVVNGEPRQVAVANVRALLSALGYDATGRGLAVALNDEIIPRGEWETTPVAPGDRIEIVGAVQGG